MIYKFTDTDQQYEMEVGYNDSSPKVFIQIKDWENTEQVEYHLNGQQLYDLIGALHSLQARLKNDK